MRRAMIALGATATLLVGLAPGAQANSVCNYGGVVSREAKGLGSNAAFTQRSAPANIHGNHVHFPPGQQGTGEVFFCSPH